MVRAMTVGGIQVLYVDDGLIVVDKPAGLLAVPGRGADKQDCVVARVQVDWPDVLVVHRLDMATSGLMLLARGIGMQRPLSRMFAQRQIVKRYVAVVAGQLHAASGCIDLPAAPPTGRSARCKGSTTTLGKAALTHWRVLHRNAAGRHHAGRTATRDRPHAPVARAPAGHRPCDPGRCAVRARRPCAMRADRLLLHACELELPHPATAACWACAVDVPF